MEYTEHNYTSWDFTAVQAMICYYFLTHSSKDPDSCCVPSSDKIGS